MRHLFVPTARQLNVLIAIGLLALGYAIYLRYLVIEQTLIGLACDGGLPTWLCSTRHVVIRLFQHGIFGIVALGAAGLNLVRPSLVLFTIGLVAGSFGVVLYNVGLSGLAVGLLILSLARPVNVPEWH